MKSAFLLIYSDHVFVFDKTFVHFAHGASLFTNPSDGSRLTIILQINFIGDLTCFNSAHSRCAAFAAFN